MTFLEVITSIETLISKMGFKYKSGEPMEPEIAIGKIGKFHGARFDFVIEATKNGDFGIEKYFTEMIRMIQEYQQRERK